MIVTRALNPREKDLLIGNEIHDLLLLGTDEDILLLEPAPVGGWTHDALEECIVHFEKNNDDVWDAYLGKKDNWIGSSEV